MTNSFLASLREASQLLTKIINNNQFKENFNSIANCLTNSLASGGKILSCGNGGSMCDATHFAEELLGKYGQDRAPLPAISINDGAYISCTANDYNYSEVFARAVTGLIKQNDCLMLFTTSGNSENIFRAAIAAKAKKAKVIGLLGKDGGKVLQHCDYSFVVPSENTARIQEVHIKIVHSLIESIETELKTKGVI